MVKLTVGVVPVADIAPLYLGISRGFFSAQRLSIVPKPVQQGSLIINQAGPGLYSAIFVKARSPIKTPPDLAGRRVAVNAVANVGPLVISAALQKSGVDIHRVSPAC